MEFNFKNKCVLITGGSRGIGLGISKMYLNHGAKVLLTYNKSEKEALELLSYAQEKNYDLKIFKLDLNNLNEVNDFINSLNKSNVESIDILINNSGICDINPLFFQDDEKILSILNVNLINTIILTKYIVKDFMLENSKIINISSIWGKIGASCEVVYSASKGGINSFTKALAKELKFSKIQVIGISPGMVETKMNDTLTCEEKNEIIEEIPLKKIATVDNVVDAIKFFSSSNITITGQIIGIDGGWSLC